MTRLMEFSPWTSFPTLCHPLPLPPCAHPSILGLQTDVEETLRWRPINKLGTNHYVTEDDWYEGYFIPKNSIIMINLWAMHYDPEFYPEPEKVFPSAGMMLTVV